MIGMCPDFSCNIQVLHRKNTSLSVIISAAGFIGGRDMKTAWFYAQRELRRRYLHFAGGFFFVGTAIFIPMTLYGYTEAVNGNGWNEQHLTGCSQSARCLTESAV